MKRSQLIRTALLFLSLSLVSSVSTYAMQGRGQAKGKSDKQDKPDKGKPDTQAGKAQGPKAMPPGQVKKQARLSQELQQQLIRQQQQRVVVYRQRLDRQQILAAQYAAQLQKDRRNASYAYQQLYIARLRQQQVALQRVHNYDTDPYFYTAPTYRYARAGTTYEVNQYGADTLRQAVNSGFSEGFRSGQADRQDAWKSGYRDSYAYQDANYGYDGYYGDQEAYNHYFREGFSRGYEDGYNSRSQYGTAANGNSSLLGNILQTILNLQALR
jgi:hypothetical protein